jgi:hypothetical protein
MTKEEFNDLNRGDLIKHRAESTVLIVTANYGDRITAVETWDVTNPDEWAIVRKADYRRVDHEN